jgi:hypothetical protein
MSGLEALLISLSQRDDKSKNFTILNNEEDNEALPTTPLIGSKKRSEIISIFEGKENITLPIKMENREIFFTTFTKTSESVDEWGNVNLTFSGKAKISLPIHFPFITKRKMVINLDLLYFREGNY